MLLSEMRSGKPLEIYINRDGYNYRVVSKIEDVSQGRVCVTLIASKKRVFEFLETDVVDIIYRDEDKMWKWKSVVGGVAELNGEKFHCFYSDKEGESFNRRNAYRVFVGERLTVHYMLYDEKRLREFRDIEALHNQMAFNYDASMGVVLENCFRYVDCDAVLKDISEDGAGLYLNQKLEIGGELTFEFETAFGTISCRAKVVRRLESHQGAFKYYYGCRLLEVSRNLSKYIYDMQSKQLRKARELKR